MCLDFIPPSRLVCIPLFESLKDMSRDSRERGTSRIERVVKEVKEFMKSRIEKEERVNRKNSI